MRMWIVLVLIGAAIAFGLGFGFAMRTSSPGGSVIPRDVIAGGGGSATTLAGQILDATIGQPATAVSTASNGTTLIGGFQTMPPGTASAARRWDLY